MAKLIYSAITSLDGDAARRLAAAPKGSGPRLALRTRIHSVLADLTSFVGRRRELAETPCEYMESQKRELNSIAG